MPTETPLPPVGEIWLKLEETEWIRIESLDFSISTETTLEVGSGRTLGGSLLGAFEMTMDASAADPLLRLLAAQGANIELGQIELWSAGRTEFIGEYAFSDGLIVRHALDGPGHGEASLIQLEIAAPQVAYGPASGWVTNYSAVEGGGGSVPTGLEGADALGILEAEIPQAPTLRYFLDPGALSSDVAEITNVAFSLQNSENATQIGSGRTPGRVTFDTISFDLNEGEIAALLRDANLLSTVAQEFTIYSVSGQSGQILETFTIENVLVVSSDFSVTEGFMSTTRFGIAYEVFENEVAFASGRFGIAYDISQGSEASPSGPSAEGVAGGALYGTAAAEEISGTDYIDGGAGDDTLSMADTILGGAGDDLITDASYVDGGTGDDTVSLGSTRSGTALGGGGNDTLTGGAGDDTLLGGAQSDHVSGGDGADSLDGGAGNDTLAGQSGADTLLGGSGSDRLTGGTGADLLQGGGGNDVLQGQSGFDALFGGSGNDRLTGDNGQDTLDGGTGNDTLEGGDKRDVFVFALAGASNSDRILDFTDDVDVLRLTNTAYTTSVSGGDGILDWGNGQVLRLVGFTDFAALADDIELIV